MSPISLQHADGAICLEDVRPMGWELGEACEFGSALTRLLECAGDSLPYHTILGVTGLAFRFVCGPDLWNPGMYGFSNVWHDTDDLIRRALSAAGYQYELREAGGFEEDVARIEESLGRGLPVMLKGEVVDASDWALISGLCSGGETLLGLSSFSGPETLHGYYAIGDWHRKARRYLFLGKRQERPPLPLTYAGALPLAVQLLRGVPGRERYTGLAAYEHLAAALRSEQFVQQAEQEEEGVWVRYLCLLCYNMMLDDHASAPPFLRDAAAALPGAAAALLPAAECYDRARELREELKRLLPEDFTIETQRSVLDAALREEYAQVLLLIRDSDRQALTHLEQALALL